MRTPHHRLALSALAFGLGFSTLPLAAHTNPSAPLGLAAPRGREGEPGPRSGEWDSALGSKAQAMTKPATPRAQRGTVEVKPPTPKPSGGVSVVPSSKPKVLASIHPGGSSNSVMGKMARSKTERATPRAQRGTVAVKPPTPKPAGGVSVVPGRRSGTVHVAPKSTAKARSEQKARASGSVMGNMREHMTEPTTPRAKRGTVGVTPPPASNPKGGVSVVPGRREGSVAVTPPPKPKKQR